MESVEQVTRSLSDQERAKLNELDEAIAKFEGQKRWTDVIKSILAKAEIVVEPSEKIELLVHAGQLFLEKSSNQAEAIKCYEQVLELDPQNVDAITQLKDMYERRRDWEKLVRTMEREAELLDPADRGVRYQEMAQLATERLRKPDVCIDLWQKVLENDAENPDALAALAGLYERSRDWERLAGVLEKQSRQILGVEEQKLLLTKLGMIYADKLNDDRGAVDAFQRLLAVDPEDRRAQEQLKRRYIALKSWDDLEDFYASLGKQDELIRTFEREAQGKDATSEEQSALMFRVARLWLGQEKPDRAARAYEKILELDPDSLEAARALTPIYESAGDPRKLSGVLEVQLRHVAEIEDRVPLLRQAGALYEERLRRPADAFESYLEAFALDPAREDSGEDIKRLAPGVDGWERVISAYKSAIGNSLDEEVQIWLRLHLATVLEAVGRTDEAIAQFRAVYELRPDNLDVVDALDRLYRHTGAHQELLEIYDGRLQLEPDPNIRLNLAYGRASLLEHELKDAAQAIDAYESIVSEWGEDQVEAHRALDRLFESQERWDDLARSIERRIELGPESDEELAALKYRLAVVADSRLNERERALELLNHVLTLVPEHDGAREQLEGMLSDREVGSQAAEILQPIYESRNDWTALTRALEVLVDGAEEPERKLELLTRIGEVASTQMGDRDLAFQAYARALRTVPEDETTLARTEALAIERNDVDSLVRLLEELADATTDPVLARRLWVRAAEIHESQRNAIDSAVAAYAKVLEHDPSDIEVLDAQADLFRRAQRPRDLVGALRRKAELAVDVNEKEELYAQVAFIHEESLDEPDRAAEIYQELLELEPSNRNALTSLDRLYEKRGQWTELADNIGRQLSLASDPDEQTELLLRLAALRETRMDAVDAAVEIYRDVLERDPNNERALASLERLLQQPEHESIVAEILEPIYRDTGAYTKLIGIHEIQARLASSPDRTVELLHQIAELYESVLDDAPSAFASYARALAVEPTHAITQGHMERIADVTADYNALAAAYETQVANLVEPVLNEDGEAIAPELGEYEIGIATSLLIKAAEVREHQLGDRATAIQHYQQVLDLDPQHLDAASALERLYTETEQYELLQSVLLRKAGILDIPEERKDHLFRAAQIANEILERPADAVGVYQRILEVDPEDLGALDSLIELYLRMERWPELLDIYGRKADVIVDPEEKKLLFVEVGTVYERELGDQPKAIDTYQRILEIDPDDSIAINRLDALYLSTENWQELRAILEREADLAADPNDAIACRYRIAELYDKRLDDPQRAIDGYQEILLEAPDHQPTLDALEAMIEGGKMPLQAALVLEPVYQGNGDWANLVRALEVQAQHSEDPTQQVELLHRIAQLQEAQLENREAAFNAYARALPLDNGDEATLGHLERLAADLGAFEEVAKLYDAEVEKLDPSSERRTELALRVASIYETQLQDLDSAIARYNLVLAADDAHLDAIEALDRLYETSGRWQELARVLGREIQLAVAPDQMLDLQFRLGQVHQHHLGQVDVAIDQYREILAAAPEHFAALEALEQLFEAGVQPLRIGEILEPLYRAQEAWDRLIGIQVVALEHQSSPAERIAMMQRIAEIAEERASDSQLACEWHQRVLFEAPLDEHSLAEAERLAGSTGQWEQLANTYADVVEKSADPSIRVPLGKRMARVYEDEVGDIQSAVSAYLFVLNANPNEGEALEALDRIYQAHGASEALQEVLARRASATSNGQDLVELHYRRAQVLENDLGRIDEAVSVYTRIVDSLDSEHEPSIKALGSIYAEKQDWPSLYRAFEREHAVALGDTGRADVLAKMARLSEQFLGDDERAIHLWKEVLELRGEDPEALNVLGDLYAKAGRWSELVDILDREAAISTDDLNRVQVYSDLGRIWYAQLRNERNAIENWQRVLDIDPTNTTALFALAEIHRAAGNTSELVDALHRVIEVGPAQQLDGSTLDDAELESVHMQLGELYEKTLRQPADAVTSYNHALDINPANFAAMDALEGIHTAEAQWAERVDVYERRAEALEEPDAKIEVLLAIAQTWATELEDADKGTRAYERVLALAPRHEAAFAKLIALHTAAERWDSLVEVYINRTETCESAEERIGLLRKIAAVQNDKILDSDQAFDTLLIAWEDDYRHPGTAEDLEKIAGQTRRWNDLLTAANTALQESEAAQDPATRIALCLRCAKWYSLELGHPEYAIPYYQQIQQLDPNNVPAQQQLAMLYRSTAQWQLLAQTLGYIVDLTEDPTVKAETYTQMGELCETQLNIPEQARNYYVQAVDSDPTYVPGLEALAKVHRAAGEWQALLDLQRQKVSVLRAPEAIATAKLEIAETYEDRLGDVDQAIGVYRDVWQKDPTNLRALKGLERLYAQRERWGDLLEVIEQQFEVVTTEKERINLLLRAAAMWEEEFIKPDRASERLEKVLEIEPTNETALRSLERIYRNQQKWDRLIQTYERHVAATPDRSEKQELLAAIGDVYGVEQDDLDRAVDAYLNILQLNPDNARAHEALSRLYTRRGDYGQALESMQQLTNQLHEPEKIVDLHHRMGELLDVHLGDRVSAVEHYESALDVDPGHLPSLAAMRKIHLDTGDWLAAAKTLQDEAHNQPQPRVVARLLVELGRLYEDKLDEHDKALIAWEDALSKDEDNEEAALPLAEEYSRTGDYTRALPLLDMLVKRSGKRSAPEQHRLAFLLGEAALETGDTEGAIKALSKAAQLDQQHLPTLLALSNAYYRAQNWEQAFRYYQMLLVHHRDALGRAQITDVFYRLGVIKREQGDRRKAHNMFDKALEEDPQHRPTLEAIVDLYQTAQDYEQAIFFKKKVLEVASPDERFMMLQEIGDTWYEQLRNPQKAIQSYAEAAEIRPNDLKLLHKLMQLYLDTKQWDLTIATIEKISELDTRPAGKAKRAYTVAVILRDEVKDPDRAVEYFNRALDLDYGSQLKAFEAINKILNAKKDWKQLERAYRKMLHRVAEGDDAALKYNLAHSLGVIYRDRMKQPETAIEAFKMALTFQPESSMEHQILAELYTMTNQTAEAIGEHQWLLRQDPYRVDSYQALYKLYFDARAYDKAWCLASTLVFLKRADQEQTQFYQQYRPKGGMRPSSRLDNERWLRELVHPDQDVVTSKIFEVLWPALLSLKGKQDRDAGLAPKYQVDPANSTVTLARTYGFAAQVMGLQTPRLFLRQDLEGGLTHMPVWPFASLCGSSLLSGYQTQDLMFICARHLSDYRGEHYIRTLMPSNSELKTVLMAGLALAGLVPPSDPSVEATVKAIAPHLTPAQVDALRSLGGHFLDQGARTDIKKWLQAVELTSCRAGLLMCNDLEAAARMLQALGPAGPVDLPTKEKLKELVLFSVSEEYFRLRQALGISLNVA